ncbi:alpha/beta hydrolase [Alteromonas lipotrueae]|uniref:alpha/beta hydrolase n=1 Tax=Alteromonas lipotrueae TaxID=2803814 RepID=UPI001C48E552|nr:alpha/beta hydrolase [Alteromonas lipotrueae]
MTVNNTSTLSKKIVKSSIIFSCILLSYFTISFSLIFWPTKFPFSLIHHDVNNSNHNGPLNINGQHMTVTARDGKSLYVRKIGPDSQRVIVFIHGIATTHQTLINTATQLHEATGAQILLPDLRGHGFSQGDNFDVAYIGQYEDDLEDILLHLTSKTNVSSKGLYRHIIIGGHSMGGGITMRYALKDNKPDVDGYLLFAPNFGEGPTQRKASGDMAGNSPILFNTTRMIGLLMLNTIGINHLDSLAIMYFNFPQQMMAYSYSSIMSAQPIRPDTTDKALLNIPQPLIAIIGQEDEVFLASAYPSFIRENSALGSVELINHADHMSILSNPQAIEKATAWLRANF